MLNDKGQECGFNMAGKKTSNLKVHIKARHETVYKQLEKSETEKQCKPSTTNAHKRKCDPDNEGMPNTI